ncbi:MAG: EAL domain-containing protein [Tatlockia sp.]|nr:EAL domain-containing protein [Tatlockia sp.]
MNNPLFHIIIIDDNPDIHQDFIKILKLSNDANQLAEFDSDLFGETSESSEENLLPEFKIETATQGEEGVLKVREALENGNPFALAFVDIRMPPGIDGIKTIKKIWELDQDMQIVICTAYSDYSWKDTVKNLGVNDNLLILKKPFDVEAVKQLASTLTKKWLMSRDTKRHTASLNKIVDQRTESLKQSLALLRATIEASTDGILVVNLEGTVIDYNQQFIKLWNIPESMLTCNSNEKLLNHMLDQQIEPKKYLRLVKKYLKKIDGLSIQIIKLKNKKIFECYSKPHLVGSKITGRIWSFHDITEQVQLKDKLVYQATHDALTGLPNRTLLLDRINQELAHAARNNTQIAFVFMDLDRFKLINDNLSHEVGDLLLRDISDRLASAIRKVDTIARLGGDEFVLVFPLRKIGDEITTIVRKILHVFQTPFLISLHKIKITMSLGISIYPTDGITANTLLSKADLAMYQAKAMGGNQYVTYSKKDFELSENQFQLEADLQNALDNQDFFLNYQPQFDIENKKIISIEALLRWQHPEKGVIDPKDFIPAAERSGIIIPLGEWVINEACKQVTIWHKMGLPLMTIAVNVATKQLRQPNFPNVVEKILKDNKIDPRFLEIEITENVIVDERIQGVMLKLKEIGCSIVLDDFGTGNSSLTSLTKLHIDRLKIDKSFVKNINCSRGDEAIIEAMIAISHAMNFKVIAEGIEHQNQLDFLRNMHCDLIQGFLWSKPLSAEGLEQFLRNQLPLVGPRPNDSLNT